MNLAAHKDVHPQVNAIANQKLSKLKSTLVSSGKNDITMEMIRRIDAFVEKPNDFKIIPVSDIPDGSPIGMGCFH